MIDSEVTSYFMLKCNECLRRRSMKKGIVFLITTLTAVFANAHNVWIESVDSAKHEYVVKFGHQETEGYSAKKLEEVTTVDSSGAIKPVAVTFSQQHEAHFTLATGDIVFLKFNNGVWSKLPNGRYVEKTKAEEPTAVLSMNPMKYGKAILSWGEQAFKPHQQPYELVPLEQPKAGKPVSILVLHQGKPVAGIKVGESEDKPFNLTNEKGIATFQVKAGENRIWAEFDEKVDNNADYDSRSIEYLLTFNVE